MTIYLDSNIFIYAASDELGIGKKCRALLVGVKAGNENAVTSALAFSESVHVVRKTMAFEESMDFAEAFLTIPNLRIISVNQEVLASAIALIRQYRLLTDDAIHISTALLADARVVYSQDKEWKKIREINVKEL